MIIIEFTLIYIGVSCFSGALLLWWSNIYFRDNALPPGKDSE